MKYLIVGLGNIGLEYELTRHNIGFLTLDRLADQKEASSWQQGRLVFETVIKHKGRTIHLIKPTTFMNLSGKAVSFWMKELNIPIDRVLVVTDDLAIDYGKLRMRKKGSAGGHNGLKNIEEQIGSQEYARLRFGVGDSFAKGRQIDYVLSPFDKKELEDLTIHMDRASEAILAFCTVGSDRAMSQYNG
ncbi:MAG: PTH1 family peptidyl-tRNA hydrolase [Cyclobacteriaceae bacterium]|jgi:PTH1 family peptidyl-tRNA hydrolase